MIDIVEKREIDTLKFPTVKIIPTIQANKNSLEMSSNLNIRKNIKIRLKDSRLIIVIPLNEN